MIKVKVNGLKTKTIWDLENFQGNLKKLDKDAKDKLKANILKNGFISPVFVWKGKDYVLDGHQRILVVKELIKEGHELETKDQIPVVEIEAETKKQAGEYVLSYNAQYGKITDEGLLEFGKEFELDFNELTETINLEFPQDLFNEENELNDVEPDDPRMIETEIKIGEVYKLGEHKLMCGDATSEEDIKKLMGEEKADMVFTDPPYGVNIVSRTTKTIGGGGPTKFKGTIGGGNIVKATQYHEVIGDETTETAKKSYDILIKHCKNLIIFGGNYFTDFLPVSRCWICWNKKYEEMESNTFADIELAWTSFDKNAKIYSCLWRGLLKEGEKDKRVHPTQKPIKLCGDIINDFTKEKQLVLDVFGGSGSTLIACENTNRKCRMMEIDPVYCQVIINRWERLTGNKAEKVN